jgi:hypothetical protein
VSAATSIIMPQHDRAQAERFLTALDPVATKFTFALFDDKAEEKAGITPNPPRVFHASLDEVWPKIVGLNRPDQRYGVFVAVNEAKDGDRKNIVRVRALYADADTPEQRKNVIATATAAGIKPSMIVKSSGDKFHGYWLLEIIPPPERARLLQRDFVERMGADRNAKDISRVMRLPGTLHLKGEPQLVRLMTMKDSPRRYEAEGLLNALGLAQNTVIPFNTTQRASMRPGTGLFDDGLPDNVTRPRFSAEMVAEAHAELSGGIGPQSWFDILPDSEKDDALRHMLHCRLDLAKGGRDGWIRVLMAASRSGAPSAEEIARAWSAQDARHTDAEFDTQWESFGDHPDGVSIGTLIAEAEKRGFDRQGWRDYAEGLASTEAADVSAINDELSAGHPNALGGPAMASASPRPPNPNKASAAAVHGLLGAAESIDLNAQIPHRQFVLGSLLLRGEVTILAAPGGRAKTALATAWACSLSSGRDLIGNRIHGPAKRVVYVSTEDNRAELQRRFRAAAMAHSLTSSDLANIQIIGVDGVRFTLTGGTERAPTVNQNGLAALARLAGEKKADVLILDPLGPLVPSGLNDNGLMGGLLLGLKQAAVGGNFALLILHHFKKGADGSAESISGASAIVNHARAALTIESMDDKAAEAFGVWPGDQYRWLRVVSLKANLTPPADSDDWLHLASVTLQNAEPPDYPYGDSVQAIVKPIGGPTATRLDPSVQAAIKREFVKCVRAADTDEAGHAFQ